MDNKLNINFFWALNPELNEMSLLSLHSFHKKGYECILWCYNEIPNVPDYVIIKDASEIIPYNDKIYVAHLSDEFRMIVLNTYGGIYSDLDNILLKPLPETEYIFAGTYDDTINNIIKTPKNSILTNYLVENTEVINQPLNLHLKKQELNLDKWCIPVKDINYFDRDLSELTLEMIDWSTVDSYMVHLLQSKHRACYKNSEIYLTNMDNLKKFIYE